MKFLVLAALRGYKRYLSPVLPSACRYVPTCSDYAMEAVERNGVLRGGVQGILRFLRCNPFGGHGFDPVVDCKSHAAIPSEDGKSVVAGGEPALR
jgi:putative membrane protein insertion efficiency factor